MIVFYTRKTEGTKNTVPREYFITSQPMQRDRKRPTILRIEKN